MSEEEEEDNLDDGIEPGAVKLTMKERNKKSIDALRAINRRHKYAFYLTCCILLWHVLFVLVLGVTTLGIPYDWEGKLKIKGVPDIPSRRLHHKPDEPIVNYCVEPNLAAQEHAKFWCDEKFYNMLYKNEKQGPHTGPAHLFLIAKSQNGRNAQKHAEMELKLVASSPDHLVEAKHVLHLKR